MNGVWVVFHRCLASLCFLAVICWSGAASSDCSDGNILVQAEIVGQKGVRNSALLSDGWGAPEGSPSVGDVTRFGSENAEITWEFGGPTQIAAMDIQAGFDDTFLVLGSSDGSEYQTLWDVPVVHGPGLQSRSVQSLAGPVRFVKIRARGGGSAAIAELRLFCRMPAEWPSPRLVRLAKIEKSESTATYQSFSGKLVVALIGLFLVFIVAPRLPSTFRNAVLLFVIALSALGWTHFGQFQGKTMIHSWDMFHYYIGSKYYKELGYLELYRCVAQLEHERGNEDAYRGIRIRDLDDNTLYPFSSWTKTEAGRCRATFTDARWNEFGRDVETFRAQMDSPPFEHVVGDHGFNATPFHATWLSAVTQFTSPSGRTLRVLAQIDNMALLTAVFSLAWGFGLPVAAVAALLIQVAAPWCYNWVGGGLGRHVWFALACLGLALLKQKSPGRGTAALTAATLLRLFPIVLLGGLGIYFLCEWARARRLSLQVRRAAAGFAVTLGVGVAVVATSFGTEPFPEFAETISEHADTPAANRMGFPHLLSLGPGKLSAVHIDDRLTDPTQPWKQTVEITLRERKPLWLLGVFASLCVLGWSVWTIRSAWVSVLAAAPLLYSVQSMTSYDYMWLVLLVPAAFRRRRALKWLCGFAIFSQVVGIVVPDVELRHWIDALTLFPTMIVFAGELVEWGRLRREASRVASG